MVHVYIHTRHAVEGKSRMTFCAHLCVYVYTYPFCNFLSLCKLKLTIFMTTLGPKQYLYVKAYSVCMYVSVSAL